MKRHLAAWMIAAAALIPGCGKKGAPVPPAPRGPLPPAGVEARQLGQELWVSFTVPDPRGDKPGQRPSVAELLRVEFPSEPPPPADPDAFRRRGQIVGRLNVFGSAPRSRSAFRDDEGYARFAAGKWALRYGVRVRDERGRLSPLVIARDLIPVPAPEAPLELTAEATGEGVRLRWSAPPGESDARFNLYRSESGQPIGEAPIHPQPLAETEYLDPGIQPGHAYTYVVRTAASEGSPYRESASSNVVSIDAADRRAPEAPKNMVAVQEGSAIRLFWDPSPERDIAGYRLYRRSGEAPWQRIGPDLIDRPLYLDRDVAPGQHHAYRVTAIDRADPPNESEPSQEVPFDVGIEPADTGGAGQ